MTAIPRGRSMEIGMGTTMRRVSTFEAPKLNRTNSSSMNPTASSSSAKVSRAGSSGKQSSLDRSGSNAQMTFTDLFLSDLPESVDLDARPAHMKPFVPLPATVNPAKEKIARQDSKPKDLGKPQGRRLQSEMQLQEYWKSNAEWPCWPQLKDSRERMRMFKDDFQEGVGSPNLIRHCGEYFKCSAYVVVCAEKIGIRSLPTLDPEQRTGDILYPGQMVIVENVLQFGGVNYLKLRSGGGWVFDHKGNTQCMSYMTQVEMGLWWYQVISLEYAEIRCSPSFREVARTGHILTPGEVVVVALRCCVGGHRWMALADGRGWIFEMKPPIRGSEDLVEERVISECDEQKEDTAEPTMNMKTGGSVEVGTWEYEVIDQVLAIGSSTSGWLLAIGEIIFVDMRVPANGLKVRETSSRQTPSSETRIWLRLHDGRGWIPKTHVDGLPTVRFRKVPNSGSQNPKHQNPTKAEDVDWESGVA